MLSHFGWKLFGWCLTRVRFPAQTVTEATGSQGKEVHYTSGSISPSVRTIPLSMKDDSICLPSHSACPSAPSGPCLPAHRPPWFVRIWSPGMIIDLIGGDEWRAFYGAWIISWRHFWGIMEKVYGSNGKMVLLLFDKPSTRAVCSVCSWIFSGIASSGRRSVIESWLWSDAKSLQHGCKSLHVQMCVLMPVGGLTVLFMGSPRIYFNLVATISNASSIWAFLKANRKVLWICITYKGDIAWHTNLKTLLPCALIFSVSLFL